MQQDPHFKYIFWFIVGITVFGALYTVGVTFLPLPKGNERFADTGHVFWLSTAVSGGIGYLLGSSAQTLRKMLSNNKQETPGATFSAEITATTAPATNNGPDQGNQDETKAN